MMRLNRNVRVRVTPCANYVGYKIDRESIIEDELLLVFMRTTRNDIQEVGCLLLEVSKT